MPSRHNVLVADQRSATVPLDGGHLRPSERRHMRKLTGIGFDAAHNQPGGVGAVRNGNLVHRAENGEWREGGLVNGQRCVFIAF